MDDRVRHFVETVAQTIVGLDVALFYQANPSTFDTAAGLALRTHRGVSDVKPALERLADHGILERHPRGEGKYVCYALARSAAAWDLLCRVSEAFHDDAQARKEIVKMLTALQVRARATSRRETADRGEGL